MPATKIDGHLNLILGEILSQQLGSAETESMGITTPAAATAPEIPILLHHTGTTTEIEAAGCRIVARFGDVASARATSDKIAALAELPSVIHIEGPHPMHADLEVSVPDVKANTVHNPGIGTPPQTYRGTGVIVGIIDGGVDFTHAAFRKTDGTSRILFIWDQSLVPQGGEASPTPYGYGVEYTKANIDSALTNAAPFTVVRHKDDGVPGHGTHVTGIAAGNGRAAGTFVGVAPEADIILVAAQGISDALGDSVRHAEAVRYILEKAGNLSKPAVINMSLGDNIGAHDGTSLLERAIDFELGQPGRCMCKSAGNAAADQIVTRGTVAGNGTHAERMAFGVAMSAATADLWYNGSARLSVRVTDPAGKTTTVLAPPATNAASATQAQTLPSGNRVAIDSSIDNRFNRDNRILIRISRGTAASVITGNWTINLTEISNNAATFDAWIQRGNAHPTFPNSPDSRRSSISIPGTSREVIAVGCYQTKPGGTTAAAGARNISSFSSRGPTRDGRIKPDISAPGEDIMAPLSSSIPSPGAGLVDSTGKYQLMAGTSMATPHVTGAVALILQKTPSLRQAQVVEILKRSARADSLTGTGNAVPNNNWGYGKLDVAAALTANVPTLQSRNWVRIRPQLGNWTMADAPPIFQITANENGTAVIELAWDPQALLAPSTQYPEKIRYYGTDQPLDATITKADGSNLRIQIPEQPVQLTGNRFDWTMPQSLWDGFREECLKSLATPARSTFARNIYYRVWFTASGASSALVWPPDSAIQANPNAPHMGIIALRSSPTTQVAPDREAVLAMDRWGAQLDWMWQNLPETDPNRQALVRLFGSPAFTNGIETAIRGKILKLWLFAGRTSRLRIPDLLNMQFRTSAGLEMTVLKQPDLKGGNLLIDHLLELMSIAPHPDMLGIRIQEELVADVIKEIMDPNGQVNQGRANTCGPTGLQTYLINVNAAEYARLQRGLLSVAGKVILANNDTLEIPPGIFQAVRYSGAQNSAFFVRTNSELAFQSAVIKYAKGNGFPSYDPNASPDASNGINTVFQATVGEGLTAAEMEHALEGLLGRNYNTVSGGPSADIRNQFLTTLTNSPDPLVLILHWRKPPSDSDTRLHTVVALRTEGGRIFFKNPQYAGSRPPNGALPNSTTIDPPRRFDDPTQSLESIGDNDLSSWIKWFHA